MFRVLAFTVKPCESADSRYRILQYYAPAQRDGISIEHRSLIGSAYFRWQTGNEMLLIRLLLYPILLAIRLCQVVFLAPKYDAVWVSREMAPIGPPMFEKLLISRCQRVILDVDDALHISDKDSSRFIPRLLRDRTKFGRMAASYTAVVCGNQYLADYYSKHAAKVFVIPTVVDANRYASVISQPSEIARIGWIGTPLNRQHLDLLRAALTELASHRRFELIIVGLERPLDWSIPTMRYIEWELKNELNYFSQFDIGVMPLENSPYARGKCAFKLIQYMAAGLPVVASSVGANCDVVFPGRNGFLATTDKEWQSALQLLIDNADLRRRMGENGRELVRRAYSVESVWPRYSNILTGVKSGEAICAR